MFSGCSGLISLDVSKFDTGNVTDMEDMFQVCSGLTSLDVSMLETDNVINMNRMFSLCYGLVSLDVSNFNMKNITDANDMFVGLENLNTLIMPANIPASLSIALPYLKAYSDITWMDENGTVQKYALTGLSAPMTYKRVNGNPSTPETKGTILKASSVTSKTDTIPENSSFTVTSDDPKNPTVAFDGVSDVNAKAVKIPRTVFS
jgi:surface protein